MNKFLIEWKIERLYRRGNKLLERLDYITVEHAKHRQETEEADESDNILSAYEHALKSDLYGINARLFKFGQMIRAKVNLFDFEYNDYSGVLA